MQQEVTAKTEDSPSLALKGVKAILLVLVWVPFLASNYLTLSHLVTWLKTDTWPSYSTENLFSDMNMAHGWALTRGIQPTAAWVMSAPATYVLMTIAIVLSIIVALLPDN
jgi:hypothetical protein